MECQYCKRTAKNQNSLRQHEIRCKENPMGLCLKWTAEMKQKQSEKMKIVNTNSERIWTDEMRERASKKQRQIQKKVWENGELKVKHSEIMKKAVKEHPESYSTANVSGRVKIIQYNGFSIKGAWELIVAKWLDSLNIKWTNLVDGVNYNWNDSTHIYFPDFYLIEYDVYIEVKGYKRERDKCKWNEFPYKLIILQKNEIKQIERGMFDIKLFIESLSCD